MEPQSKENILTKTDLTNNEEIYTSMKKTMKEMKSNITVDDRNKEEEESKTFYGYRDRYEGSRNLGGRPRDRNGWERRNSYLRSRSQGRYQDYKSNNGDWKRNDRNWRRNNSRNRDDRSLWRQERNDRSPWRNERNKYGNRSGEEGKNTDNDKEERNNERTNEVQITQYSTHEEREGNQSMDPYGCIIDTGCPKTVAGKV